jgi:hypothetical protein
MAAYNFNKTPRSVPFIKTRNRTIKTRIPAPGSGAIFRDLEKFESRSMHGQLPVVWDKAVGYQVFDRSDRFYFDYLCG